MKNENEQENKQANKQKEFMDKTNKLFEMEEVNPIESFSDSKKTILAFLLSIASYAIIVLFIYIASGIFKIEFYRLAFLILSSTLINSAISSPNADNNCRANVVFPPPLGPKIPIVFCPFFFIRPAR